MLQTNFLKKTRNHWCWLPCAIARQEISLNLGLSHPVEFETPEDLEIEVPSNTEIIIKGADKEAVGALAANIRAVRSPEPYKGKGVRYEGEICSS